MATGFDSEEVVGEKYPTFASIAQDLSSLTPPVPMHHSIDATKISTYKALQPSSSSSSSTHPDTDTDIDTGPYDTIAFMFPHTGGLSTDVNRQVRANQNLIVEFFRSCLQLNSTSPSKASTTSSSHSTSTSNPPPPPPSSSHSSLPSSTPSTSSVKPRKQPPPFLKTRGKIIITLFERSPYTLWNPRDLARHVGLKVLESFKFDWADYPGYAHVRTLGHIEGGGAWRGEDRSARMYVFEKVELDQDQGGEREREVEDRGGRARGKKDSGRGVKRSRDGDKEDSESGDE
ncbi:hypothetical protein K491DRAFT_691088 [Lophiostoma macrostomum CBS 122681]|uniref:25S rRNA (uridine-N(3))-methyltransferase BMT5-like domain-containing protein n=1 Tax=Lophiostoma macrostomum CBS 122681 TaxID=1314788 RepID=A0A6A6TEX6_9PLEO|nr:hypothetical protein K491DRAFT_691088 [Lophiostoma macrostomum CBS 122681]